MLPFFGRAKPIALAGSAVCVLLLYLIYAIARIETLAFGSFMIFKLIYPAFLLLRNAVSRHIVKKAAETLVHCGVKEVTPILFRCTRQELIQLGKLTGAEAFETYYNTLAEKELRWAVIRERFIKSSPVPEAQAAADSGENTL